MSADRGTQKAEPIMGGIMGQRAGNVQRLGEGAGEARAGAKEALGMGSCTLRFRR